MSDNVERAERGVVNGLMSFIIRSAEIVSWMSWLPKNTYCHIAIETTYSWLEIYRNFKSHHFQCYFLYVRITCTHKYVIHRSPSLGKVCSGSNDKTSGYTCKLVDVCLF